MAEAVMRFLGNQLKPGLLIDMASLYQDAIGPEQHFLIAPTTGEANTLFDEACAQAHAACLRFDQQKPEFSDGLTATHDKNRADDLSIHLSNPAAFAFMIVVRDEIRNDL